MADDNEIQLKWRISDEKIRLQWDNAIFDNDVVYYRVGKAVHVYNWIDNRWIQLTDCPHTDCPMAIINNQLITIGGYEPLTNKLFGLEINCDPMCWSERYPPMLTKRRRASALCTNNELIVAGGMGERMEVLTVVEVMKLDTPQWSTAANLQELTYDASIAMCLDQIFILGGNNTDWKPSESVYMCSLSSLKSPQNAIWNKIANLPVMQSTCVAYQDRLLAVGGRESTTAAAVSTVYVYNHTTNSWKVISEMKIPRSKCFAAVLPNNQLMVVGGESQPQIQIDAIEIATPTN